MSDESDASGTNNDGRGRRLPPPAFPPGSRKLHVRRRDKKEPSKGDIDAALISPDEPMPDRSDFPEDAFISPDAPIERLARASDDDAFISPDEPMPPRVPRSDEGADEESFDEDDVVVTGMGHDAHLDPEDLAMAGDPHVMEVSEVVSKLAADLKRKGEAGLRSSPEMGRFESTLRGYCVGYLAGRRAGDEQPVLEESESGSW